MGIIPIFNLPADFACYFKGCRRIDVIPSILWRSIHCSFVKFFTYGENLNGNFFHVKLLKNLTQILEFAPFAWSCFRRQFLWISLGKSLQAPPPRGECYSGLVGPKTQLLQIINYKFRTILFIIQNHKDLCGGESPTEPFRQRRRWESKNYHREERREVKQIWSTLFLYILGLTKEPESSLFRT